MLETLRTNAATKVSLLTAMATLALPSFDRVRAQEVGSENGAVTAASFESGLTNGLIRVLPTGQSVRESVVNALSFTDMQRTRDATYALYQDGTRAAPSRAFVRLHLTEPKLLEEVTAILTGSDGSVSVTTHKPRLNDYPVEIGIWRRCQDTTTNLEEPSWQRIPIASAAQLPVESWGATRFRGLPAEKYKAVYFLPVPGEREVEGMTPIFLPAGEIAIALRYPRFVAEEGEVTVVQASRDAGQLGHDFMVVRQEQETIYNLNEIPNNNADALAVSFKLRDVEVSAPPLTIAPRDGAVTVTVSWSDAGMFTLQSAASLSGEWRDVDEPVRQDGSLRSVTCACSSGSRFFRLVFNNPE